MGYDMPTENVFEARPRLGAAAVDLSRWSGVIGIRTPADADSLSCFSVTVTALWAERACSGNGRDGSLDCRNDA